MQTSRADGVKAPQHRGTPKSYVEFLVFKIVRHAGHEFRLQEPAAELREDLGRDEGRGDQREGEEPHVSGERPFRSDERDAGYEKVDGRDHVGRAEDGGGDKS
jgi:hypothetical protein